MNRRLFLATAGRIVLTVATTPAAATILASTPPDPLAPWRAAPASADPDWRVRAAGWAVLAPNPHNRQPWQFVLGDAGSLTLHCDLARRLPVTDPFDRQITIGLGAAAELFRMAAAAEGIAVEVVPFPDGVPAGRLDHRPVALLRRVAEAAAPDPLFAHVLARRSTKRAFAMHPTPDAAALAALASLSSTIGFTTASDRVAALRALMWQAWLIELETPAAHGESVALMRLGREAVAADPDGISIWGPGLDEAVAAGAITRDGFATPGSQAQRVMIARYQAMLAATPAVIWTTSARDGKDDAFAAGRDWLRLNLAATGLGLALHPVSQALQEYGAMAGAKDALHHLLGVAAPGRVQMLGRIGLPLGEAPPPTPRWPAKSRILHG
jgi:hypothetical protein